ncbi:MAG TPA: NAD(P)-dependent oxidoreductase [Baekduia sp.]|uniref:NAD-dependent epimerase/dehydratase family protein n=1 Tax=Baekduia sp. TaxID=2600305 RepID=UPI002D7673EB|nr:NAD(P)-dependent oxidoreductase [Baekduia sp.]HET6510331.1 NAD(P)-dependent oxidoreductase [Baekduia sp.]
MSGRVFITGASGFIGRALGDRFARDGYEVRGVDVAADPARGVVAGDVGAPGAWQDHAAGSDLVIHTAAIVSMSGADPRAVWRVNALGTKHVLDAATRAAGGATRVVHLSSVTVFGFAFPDGVDESYPTEPNGVPYVDTKIASEALVLRAHAAGEVPCAIVRPGDVYGPRSRPWTLLPVEEIERRRFVLPARGRGVFSPVFIDNLVDGIVLAATHPDGAGGVFTLSDGVGVTTAEFFGHYARMLGRRLATLPTGPSRALASAAALGARVARQETEINASAARYLARTGTYSIARARDVLGYAPAVSLEDGMARTEAWLRAEGRVPAS